MYTQQQIKAAKDRFELQGICNRSLVSDSQATQFLDWWHSQSKPTSELQAIAEGLAYGAQRFEEEKAVMRRILG